MRSSSASKILGAFLACCIPLQLTLRFSHRMLLLLLDNKLHLAPVVKKPQASYNCLKHNRGTYFLSKNPRHWYWNWNMGYVYSPQFYNKKFWLKF
jgi:hypothetical protein